MDRPDYYNSEEEFRAAEAKLSAERRANGKRAKAKKAAFPSITEDGAALARLYAGKLLFDHDAGAWFEWTGCHWKREGTGLALEWARQLARKLSDGQPPSIRKTAFASGVERFARVDRTFAVTSEHWDRDPFLLGTPDGTVDLRTGVLRPADPGDAISRLTAIAPAETPNCPLFLAFLLEATGADHALIRFLQMFFGYALSGVTTEHALLFIFGTGGNGKSVLLNILAWILGSYAKTAAMDAFVQTKGEKHSTDVAMLHGARLVAASEIAKGRAWNENLVKSLTGGDPITARFMRRDNFTFTPTFKLAIIGNHKPRLQSINEAARRRFNIVPLDRRPPIPIPNLSRNCAGKAQASCDG